MNKTIIMEARRWGSAAYSLWVCALIIGIIPIISIVISMLIPLISSNYDETYGMISYAGIILGLISYIAQWIQVANLGTWINILNRSNVSDTGSLLRKFQIGIIMSLIMQAIYALGPIILWYIAENSAAISTFNMFYLIFNVILVITGIIALILLIWGMFGLAFSSRVDERLSTGMKYMIASYAITLLILVIQLFILYTSEALYSNGFDYETFYIIIMFIPVIANILQIIAWRYISKTPYPLQTEEAITLE